MIGSSFHLIAFHLSVMEVMLAGTFGLLVHFCHGVLGIPSAV